MSGTNSQLDLPEGWEWSEEEGTVTIYNPDGVGALQPSFARHQGAADLGRLTSELARNVELDENEVKRDVVLGGAAAAYVEGFSRGEAHDFSWIWHAAAHPTRIARVTYNCPADAASAESRDVDRILTSCRWLGASSHN